MSKVNDNIKSDSNAVNEVLSSENNRVSNGVNEDVAKAVSNDQNVVDPKNNNSLNNDVSKKVENVVSNCQNNSHSKNNSDSNAVNEDWAKHVSDCHIFDLKKNNGVSYDVIEKIDNVMNGIANTSYFKNHYEPLYRHNSSLNTSGAVQVSNESHDDRFRQLFWNVTFATSVAYLSYQFYKKYLEKWMFDEPEPALINRIEVIEMTVQKIIYDVNLRSLKSENEIKDIMDELKSIKLLLTNSHTVPSVPDTPRLPEWQLPKKKKTIYVTIE